MWSHWVERAELSSTNGEKTRVVGLTMVIDKGLGLGATGDLLQTGGDFIDYIKLGFGTPLLYNPELLREKLSLMAAAGIATLPGGTLFELAVQEGEEAAFFSMAQRAGFSHIEVSDGTFELHPARRREYIEQAREKGFRVLSEIGKKDPTRPLDPMYVADQMQADLEAGAEKVIIEGRDSGFNVGVYDELGTLRDDLFAQTVDLLPGLDDIIWEAPRPEQQQLLLLKLGPDAGFGNVQPDDVVTLEAMRRGLRSDTARPR